MKNMILSIAAAVSAIFLSAPAEAEGILYTNAFGGYNSMERNDDQQDAGYVLGGVIGAHITSHLRCEGELAYKKNTTSYNSTIDNTPCDLELTRYNTSINGAFDMLPKKALTPYVGVGAGISTQRGNFSFAKAEETESTKEEVTLPTVRFKTAPITQEFFGVKTNMNERVDFAVEYRISQNLLAQDTDNSLKEMDQSVLFNCGLKF